ncbi:MAG: EAL domain-containing protein, partial [Actinobacteria bacterium]|nr:EAL domain-containing protein [Actinomycetota bacterium]MBW3648276.1 EAL domain-containing protein [Actinomycetota bacterium]
GRQLSDPGLVATVRAALQAHGCAAGRLVFEVTETALVTDMSTAIESMQQLQTLGAGVAIDDFGTGYSTLLYLKHLSANDLKIDRSFVRGLGVDSYDTAMVASLISLAHNLGVRCVAEGVETIEQFTLLEQLGCDFAQGYLFSRPVDAAALEAWLDRHVTTAAPPSQADAPCISPPARILALLEQGAGPHTLAAVLNSDGHRTADGVRWSARSVTRDLLHRPA